MCMRQAQATKVKGVGTFHVPSPWNLKGVGTFHVPSTWNPGKSSTARGTAESAHLYPHLLILLPSPRSGARGRKRTEITQIHWDFESGVLRNVGKDAQRVPAPFAGCVNQRVSTGPASLKTRRQPSNADQCRAISLVCTAPVPLSPAPLLSSLTQRYH